MKGRASKYGKQVEVYMNNETTLKQRTSYNMN